MLLRVLRPPRNAVSVGLSLFLSHLLFIIFVFSFAISLHSSPPFLFLSGCNFNSKFFFSFELQSTSSISLFVTVVAGQLSNLISVEFDALNTVFCSVGSGTTTNELSITIGCF